MHFQYLLCILYMYFNRNIHHVSINSVLSPIALTHVHSQLLYCYYRKKTCSTGHPRFYVQLIWNESYVGNSFRSWACLLLLHCSIPLQPWTISRHTVTLIWYNCGIESTAYILTGIYCWVWSWADMSTFSPGSNHSTMSISSNVLPPWSKVYSREDVVALELHSQTRATGYQVTSALMSIFIHKPCKTTSTEISRI